MFASRIGLCLVVGGAALATVADSRGGQAVNGPESTYASDLELEARRSSVEFLPDGDLSKPSWKHAKWAEFDNDASGKFHYPEAATRVASLWTETHIYFAFLSRYDSLNIYEGLTWKSTRPGTLLTTPLGSPVSSTQLVSTPSIMFGPPRCAYLSRR